MSDPSGLGRMVDIVMPQAPSTSHWLVWSLAAAGLLLLALVFLWRWRQTPSFKLRRLLGELDRGRLDARQAAHQLALAFPACSQDEPYLDRLRFGAKDPDTSSVRALIERRLSKAEP
ncbi:MAG: hypothetical protein ACPG4N_07795 [Gammaproteobacteria bacterium]